MMKKILFLSAMFLLFVAVRADAATLYLNLDKTVFPIGDTFTAEVRINSDDAGINAGQATISFPTSILSVESVEKTDSLFDFWLQEPSFSNENGTINFLGGSINGFSGQSLKILSIVFKIKGAGKASLSFSNAAITASDGSGTNILSETKGTDITSAAKSEIVEIAPPQLRRPAVPSEKLPIKPVLSVPLYPDSEKRYGNSENFLVRWDLPADVSDISTLVNKIPNSNPAISEGLFDNKIFPALEDGEWYLHVRFRNNVGWGPTNHYRIAIDRVPPAAFTIKITPDFSTQNPRPTLSYATTDQFSKNINYAIFINFNDPIITTSTIFMLPLQEPGKKSIRISASDLAGNATFATAELDIIPIEQPIITEYSNTAYIGEGGFIISGISLADAKIIVSFKGSRGEVIFQEKTIADADGKWHLSSTYPLTKGVYVAEVVAQNSEGSKSFPVLNEFRVRERPLLTIFNLQITATLFYILFIIILIASFVFGFWLSKKQYNKRQQRILIVQRDIINMFNLFKEKINSALGSSSDEEEKFILQRLQKEIEVKMDSIIKEVEDIEK